MPNSSFCSSRAKSSTRARAGEVALTGLGGERRRRLRLPVEQRRADRVVAVHRGGGVVGFGLLERDEEASTLLSRGVPDALAEAVGIPREVQRSRGSPRADSGRGPSAGRRPEAPAEVDGHVTGGVERRGRRRRELVAGSPLLVRRACEAVGRWSRSRRRRTTARRRACARSAARCDESSSYAGASSSKEARVGHCSRAGRRRGRTRAPASSRRLPRARSRRASAGRRHGGAASTSDCRVAKDVG